MTGDGAGEGLYGALCDPALPVPAGITTWRGEPDAKRFAVYRNNVHVGLVEALGKAFPVIKALVGDEFFTAMARVYVGQNKPVSPILMVYGETFGDFLAGFGPAASLPYLPDMARLEFAWTQSYHARDAEPLTLAGLQAILGKNTFDEIAVHPATRLIRSGYPVGTIWSAHQPNGASAQMPRGGECVLITRPQAQVQLTVIPPADAALLAQMLEGETLLDAAGAVFADTPAFDFGKTIAGLTSVGALTGRS